MNFQDIAEFASASVGGADLVDPCANITHAVELNLDGVGSIHSSFRVPDTIGVSELLNSTVLAQPLSNTSVINIGQRYTSLFYAKFRRWFV